MTAGPASGAFTYRAFINCSDDDQAWGLWLRKGLERYRVPKRIVGSAGRDGPVPKTLAPIFLAPRAPASRDEAKGPDARAAALAESAYLIVICSPAGATSHAVNEEILAFKRLGRQGNVLAVIVDGEPNAADKPGTGRLECFPDALKFKLGADGQLSDERTEPIAADARPEGDGRENALLKIIAGLLGVRYNDLKHREIEAARRRARVYQAVAGSMAVLAAVAVGGAVLARRSEQRATAMAERAVTYAGASVDNTMQITDRAGVSHALIEEFLNEADQQLTALYASGVSTPALQAQRGYLLDQFAEHYGDLRDTTRQRAFAGQARDIFAGLSRRFPNRDEYAVAWARDEEFVAMALQRQGDLDGALAAFREGVAIDQRLSAAHPSDRVYQYNIAIGDKDVGRVFREQHAFPQALDRLRAGLAAMQRLATADPSDLSYQEAIAEFDTYVGEVLSDSRNPARDAVAALHSYRAGLAIEAHLHADYPQNTQFELNTAVTNGMIGDLLLAEGHAREALDVEQSAVQQLQHLTESDPDNAAWQADLAHRERKRGDALDALGQTAAALDAYRQGQARLERLANADPTNAEGLDDLGLAGYQIVQMEVNLKHWPEAIEAERRLLTIAEKRMAANPANLRLQFLLGEDLRQMAGLQLEHRDVAAARPYLARAEPLLAKATNAATSVSDRGLAHDATLAYGQLGDELLGLLAKGDAPAALAINLATVQRMRHLVEVNPGNLVWQRELAQRESRLGNALDAVGQTAAALDAYTRAEAGEARLSKADPKNTDLLTGVSFNWDQIAQMEIKLTKWPEATDALQHELAVDDGLAAARPSDVELQLTVAYDVQDVAAAMVDHDRLAEGRRYLTRAEALLTQLSNVSMNAAQREHLAKLVDLSRTITIDAHLQGAMENVTLAHGDEALADARDYLGLKGWRDDTSIYMAVVGHLSATQANHAADGTSLLNECATKCDKTKWPYPVVQYLLREISASQVIDLATDNDKRIDAHTYVGMDLSLTGHKDEALTHLRWVVEHGNKDFFEYRLARAELARLGGTGRRP